jgi:hypothetical protein
VRRSSSINEIPQGWSYPRQAEFFLTYIGEK